MQTDCLHCANWHFNSQPREGGWCACMCALGSPCISTHSRAKAAGAAAETLNP